MRRLLRWLLFLTYPFLICSGLMCGGLGFGIAFSDDFTVENRTGQTLLITPVASGEGGRRFPLPVTLAVFLPLRTPRCGGYRLPPGEALTLVYDSDDAIFSEIVAEDEQGHFYERTVGSRLTGARWQGPTQRHYVFEHLEELATPGPAVHKAVQQAQEVAYRILILPGLLVAPWLAHWGLSWLLERWTPQLRVEPAA